MSSTFRRGLRMLEVVGIDGPIGVSELARRLGVDKAAVSRMVAVSVEDGWLLRTKAGIVLGPRLPALGYDTPISVAIREMQPIVDAVAGVTGLFTQACGLIGRDVVALISAGRPPIPLPSALSIRLPIWATAVGRAIAISLDEDELATLLPAEPFPAPESILPDLMPLPPSDLVPGRLPGWRDATSERVTTSAQFSQILRDVRADGVARERGEVFPQTGCIAAPWTAAPIAASIGVIGFAADVVDNATLAEAVLRAAVAPSADRTQVIAAAARKLAV